MSADLLIYGAGGFAREVAWLLGDVTFVDTCRIVGFVSDDADGRSMLRSLPVLDLTTAAARFPAAAIVLGIGNPAARLSAAGRAEQAGFRLATALAHDVRLDASVTAGAGLVICQGSSVTVDVSFGRAVQVNLDCTIGHDVVLEDGVTLAPGVHVSGRVHIESCAYLGTGAVVINGHPGRPLRIGAGATIGAGAVVTRDIPAGVTAIGAPAKAR